MNLQLVESGHDAPLPRIFALALSQIGARAGKLDAAPRFPSENFDALRAAGIPQFAAERERCELGAEIALVRALAAADASTARILDGHFNGVERLALHAPDELRERELEQVRAGELLLAVWGADPSSSEGEPAWVERSADGGLALRGVKTFCSGAGGVQRALVVARDEHGARRLVYADLSSGVRVDRSWYRASGLRSSESHRVEFDDTPVLAMLGGQDEITREPWFSRDAVRTAATWAGIADCILEATAAALHAIGPSDELRLHALGRMRVAQSTIDRWLEHCATRLDTDETPGFGATRWEEPPRWKSLECSRSLAGECRVALAEAARLIAAEAAAVCGSRALVGGGTLDRARRDLDLFLLQHRLAPKLVELGARTLMTGAR
jgi:alkylation response protein AidB-like acyl-CoA dehydrogenase